jgi:Siphovirus Gp157
MTDQAALTYEIARYKQIRERLLADVDDIDEQTLADTLEGATNINEMLIETIRTIMNDETTCDALDRRIDDMRLRRDRFAKRAERRRQIVRDAMLDCGIPQIKEPDFLARTQRSQPSLVIIDEKVIPPDYWEQRPHLRKAELKEELKRGTIIAGAVLSNTGMSLTIRTK